MKHSKIKRLYCFLCSLTLLAGTCLPSSAILAEEEETPDAISVSEEERVPPTIEGLTFEKKMDFTYVNAVDIYYYEGGYKFYDVYDSARYLQVPEGMEVPEGIDKDVIILPGNPDNIYMAATAAMALVNAIQGLDRIRFSSLNADGWYVEEAAEAMNRGDIVFAGKYSEPDYEMLVGQGCDLAIESTMILHTPQVQEMIENLGIPVFIDHSSYETHPLGRSEWVRVYGALLGLEEEADAFFKGQTAGIEALGDIENTGKTVAFFFVNTSGTVVVRSTSDYIPKMIEMAGGVYALNNIEVLSESKRSSVNMTMEEFYAGAVDADYLIYNSTIDSPLYSMEDLFGKSELFRDFKAVKDGNVWCADKYLYQATDITGQLIMDFHNMLSGGDESAMTFLRKIE